MCVISEIMFQCGTIGFSMDCGNCCHHYDYRWSDMAARMLLVN